MTLEKIRTEEEFKNKLDEIGQIFGVKFTLIDRDVYMTGESREDIKMENMGNHYCGFLNGKKICMRYIFSPHFFSTSVLIEVFSSDGKKRDCCRIEQELSPQSGIREYPTFTFNSYQDDTTYLFYSNSFLIETAITRGQNIHMFEAIRKYENNGSVKKMDRIAARFVKPDITRFLCGVDDSEGELYPQAQFEMYKGYRGHHYRLSVLAGNCRIYQDIKNLYKYNPNGFYAIIPFFDRDYLGETQYLEDISKLTPEEWDNFFSSIVQNRDAITCFENTIEHFNNHPVSSYICKYYLPLIDIIRSLQSGTITDEKPFVKALTNSNFVIPKR